MRTAAKRRWRQLACAGARPLRRRRQQRHCSRRGARGEQEQASWAICRSCRRARPAAWWRRGRSRGSRRGPWRCGPRPRRSSSSTCWSTAIAWWAACLWCLFVIVALLACRSGWLLHVNRRASCSCLPAFLPPAAPKRPQVFGNAAFRPQQRQIVEAALQGRDCFVLMPTGGALRCGGCQGWQGCSNNAVQRGLLGAGPRARQLPHTAQPACTHPTGCCACPAPQAASPSRTSCPQWCRAGSRVRPRQLVLLLRLARR